MQDTNLHAVERHLQQTLDELAEWSHKCKKMTLSTLKSECSFFSTCMTETRWSLSLFLEGGLLRYNANPKFLEVTYDRQLTFGPQARTVSNKIKRQVRALRGLAAKDWGYDRDTLRTTYIATGCFFIEYARVVWLPWLSQSSIDTLERAKGTLGGRSRVN